MDPFIGFFLLAVFTILAGLLTSFEIALSSLGEVRLTALLKEHSHRRPLQASLDNPQLIVSAVALAANILMIATGVLTAWLSFQLLPHLDMVVRALLAILIAMLYLLVFGEIWPKYMGQDWVLRWLRPISYLIRPLIPLISFSQKLGRFFQRLLRLKTGEGSRIPLSEDQIRFLLEAAEEHGLLDEEEEHMIQKIFTYNERVARQVMVPRPEVVSISVDTPLTQVREIIAREGHSRYPVYEGTRDNVIGILHAKDLLRLGYQEKQKLEEYRRQLHEELPKRLKEAEEQARARGIEPSADPDYQALLREQDLIKEQMAALRERTKRITLRDLIRPPYFTPTIKPLNDLLHEFQRDKRHIAIVVDEFGSMAGIVTLEDILEEIVGEISDEYDVPHKPIRQLGPREFLVDGDAELSLINEELGLNLPMGEAVTIGGLITQRLEEIPRPGRLVVIDGVAITVESATDRGIVKVRLKLSESTPPTPSPAR